MQPSRRSTRLRNLADTAAVFSLTDATAPMDAHTSADGSSRQSRKRSRARASPSPMSPEQDIESLSEENSTDEDEANPIDEAVTTENISKEQRYEESRSMYQTKAQFYLELLRSKHLPLTPKFINLAATERYQGLRPRKFINQQRISLTDENLADVKKVVTEAGLIHTLIDFDAYQPNVVREFIANLLDAEERDDGVAVYVRGSLVDFSPSLINSLYCIPGFEEDPNWMEVHIDEVCGFLTDGKINRWENMSSKFLTATNQVLYKLVCSNWIPTMNYTAMNQERLKFIYILHHNEGGFDFGKLVYDQIIMMGESTKIKKSSCIMFPTLIQQVLHFQRIVPPDTRDDEFTGLPKLVVKDVKAGRGTGADSSIATLEEDINRAIDGLKAIRIRLRSKGVLWVLSQENEEEDENEEEKEDDDDDAEESSD
ncbi:hypothetical protein N665_0072s0048 [Sinapis alba]|nr:hypothetical protein N665_0072s0048 [Sinapis alba]